MKIAGHPYGALKNDGYEPRLIEQHIKEGLEDFGTVCIQGAKYCGKTWAAQAFANSEINLMDPAGNFQNLEVALIDPETALQGSSPRLIDEWQETPLLWDAARNAVDRSGKQATFILTGSSVPREQNQSTAESAASRSCACGPCRSPSRVSQTARFHFGASSRAKPHPHLPPE